MKITLDWKKYEETAVQAISEGCVLLENKNQALPLKKDSIVSIFGRIQNDYYKSGTGSGGKVNVSKVYNIVEGLEDSGLVKINKELQKIYLKWEETHPYDEGLGWGKEKWSQEEMPLTEEIVTKAADISETALVIIGRTAGEDKDNSNTEGSFLLSKDEEDMLSKVRAAFKKVVVLLNVGNIINMNFVKKYNPDAVMYVWQGGMMGGIGTARLLTGQANPSGKLTDTIACDISDYPSNPYFGNPVENFYTEDIYVGYRYFETFAKDKVLYPFGYGLSYSDFKITSKNAINDSANQKLKVQVEVQNLSEIPGKEVIQLYIQAPDGKLGKASKILVDFEKSKLLQKMEIQNLNFEIPYTNFASYDDSGITGKKNCFLLEEGKYTLYLGSDVRSASPILSFDLENLLVIKECEEALAPVKAFQRFHKSSENKLSFEEVPLAQIDVQKRRLENIPQEIKQTNSTDIKLTDVLHKNADIKDFIAQLSDEDLSCIIRGEGMGSSLVTPGTASAYGGVSPRLKNTFKIPIACCDDGPSGMRLDCGLKAFSLPNGTLLASSFNRSLISELYSFTGLEMRNNKVDNLLGPGMNIHRHPLNGRNFEYFSEDPYLTGQIGIAMIKGLKSSGVTGTIKHFCGNNQEFKRHFQDSIISQRALREIYLKGFELAVKSTYADSVMTTYGQVNGVYTAGSYDLNTSILRKDWGFKGIVMTDWWANISEQGVAPDRHNFAAMIHAQNDLYMCCSNGARNDDGDNTLQALESSNLSRAELQRSAINICSQVMNMPAMKRLEGKEDEIEIINRPKDADDINLDDIIFKTLDGNNTFDLTYQECKANTNYILPFDVQKLGTYLVTLTASSDLDELAQLPCTLYFQGIPNVSFTFQGSQGKETSISKEFVLPTRFSVCKLVCSANGLKVKDITFRYLNNNTK